MVDVFHYEKKKKRGEERKRRGKKKKRRKGKKRLVYTNPKSLCFFKGLTGSFPGQPLV